MRFMCLQSAHTPGDVHAGHRLVVCNPQGGEGLIKVHTRVAHTQVQVGPKHEAHSRRCQQPEVGQHAAIVQEKLWSVCVNMCVSACVWMRETQTQEKRRGQHAICSAEKSCGGYTSG
eukprot:453367-Pelagomonas_calceolata.AAC.3